MYYRQYIPSAALSDFIECYWILRMPNPGCSRQRLIPGGRIEIIFNFGAAISWMISEDNQPAAILQNEVGVMGQRNRIYYASLNSPVDLIGIRLKSGAQNAFTDIPAADLLNKLLNAEDVFGVQVKSWNEKILTAKSEQEKFLALDELVFSALRHKNNDLGQMQSMLDCVRKMDEPLSIASLSHQSGWGYKKLERSFLKYTGYSPKQYMRIIRFNKALREIDRGLQSLTAIGFECGYYDQAHFIKDCIHLTGTTPGRLQTDEQVIANLLIKYQAV